MLYKRLIINGTEYLLAVSQAGSGAPTAATSGSVGVLYMDTDTGDLYKCTGGEAGAWKWEQLSEGGSGYTLPVGGDQLGGVKNGGNVVINPDGTMTAPVSDSSQNVDLTGYAKEQWVQEGFQPKGDYLTAVPAGYATEEFVKNKIAEAELGGEEVDLSGYAQKSEIPTKVSQLENDAKYLTEHQDLSEYAKKTDIPSVPVQSVNGKTGAVNLSASDVGARPATWMPTAQEVGALPSTYTPPNQTAAQVGADPKGTAASAVSEHNVDTDAHNDLRTELKALSDRLTAFFDSDDTTLDELSEIVAYITSNKTLIDSIATSKVNVADIVNNLTTNVANKPLSAAQGVVLKGLIDSLNTSLSKYALASSVPTKVSQLENDKGFLTEHQDISGKLDASELPSAINTALAQAKASGEFDGKDGQDGYTPINGVDYYTDAEKAEFEAYLAEELAKRGQLVPEFVESEEWLDANGDTSKLYVLPDGMIYAYMLTQKEVETGGGYTNRIPQSVNADGSDYVGNNGEDGYKKEIRLSSSSKSESTSNAAGMFCTGFIAVSFNDVIRIGNVKKGAASNDCLLLFKEDKTTGVGTINASTIYSNVDSNGVVQITLDESTAPYKEETKWLRLSTGYTENAPVITINEEIKESGTEIVEEYAWTSTGHAFVPADYEDRIIAVEKTAEGNTSKIAALEKAVESGSADDTETAALSRIKVWDKPVYDPAPVTLIADDDAKPALTTDDRTIDAIYAKYRALMAEHPQYITETNMGACTASDTFEAVDMLRFDFKEPDGLTDSNYNSAAVHETKPTLIFLSGIHTEWVGIWGLYYALEEIATNPDFDDVRRNAHIIVIPCANPFCLSSQTVEGWTTSHVNANGVAIHNNFNVDHSTGGSVGEYNYGGTVPCSELETQYIDAVMAEHPDAVAFVSCHNNDYSTMFGAPVIWASSATYHMCNVAFRLIDKLSKAWIDKYGDTLKEAIDTYKTNMDESDYRLGRAMMSTSKGTEQLNATKYGIQGVNLEISRMMKVFSGDTDGTSEVMTHGAEIYANFMRTLLWSYDPKDKKEYAPNLPWSE